MLKNWKTWNWAAGFIPFVAAGYLTYQEIRDDHDDNASTVFNSELVFASWAAATAILWGTTTTGQTQTIAKKEAEKTIDNQ
jgi:hypothetical protein